MAIDVVERIRAIAKRRRVPKSHEKAAYETGRVESNFTNPAGGDADSQGWRQERASLYKDPRNLDASINRFFDETAKADRGQKSYELAADVQRPAAQYRGRYKTVSGEAQKLLKVGGASKGSASKSRSATTTSTVEQGSGARDARRAALQAYVLNQDSDPDATLTLAQGLIAARDAPDAKTAIRSRRAAKSKPSTQGSSAAGKSRLLEMFWQGEGGINVKDGKQVQQGFVSGHTDHVHVAAGPKTTVELGKLAQGMGLRVGENPSFGGVGAGHVSNSYHYRDEAIDVSGDPKRMAAYARRVAKMYGIKGG